MNQEKTIVLNQNENHFPLSPLCQEVIKNISYNEISNYSHLKPSLIEVLEELFKVPQEEIALGYGSEDIMKQAIDFCIKKGDKILLPDQGWYYYKELAKEMEAEILYYHMRENEETFSYDSEEIINLLKTENLKLVMIASPNNPTSDLMKKNEIDAILNNLQKETLVIFDEAYVGFGFPEYDFHNLMKNPNMMVLRTFSKFYALAGIRIGYAFLGKNWMPFRKKLHRYLGFNHFTEKLAIASLKSFDYYTDIAKQINQESIKYFNELKKMDMKPFKTETNFIFARLNKKDFDLLKEELPKKKIIIKFFDEKKEPSFSSCIRISIGLPEENKEVLQAFHTILNR